jgi:hypothetical protein
MLISDSWYFNLIYFWKKKIHTKDLQKVSQDKDMCPYLSFEGVMVFNFHFQQYFSYIVVVILLVEKTRENH